jgi:uncharacterized membrane protein
VLTFLHDIQTARLRHQSRNGLPTAAPPSTHKEVVMIDIAFNKFLTLKIIKVAWVVCVILAVLSVIASIAYGLYGTAGEPSFNEATGEVIEGERTPVWLVVLLGPVLAVVWLLFVRIALELVAVVFRIAENTRDMARAGSAANGGTGDLSSDHIGVVADDRGTS